MRWTAAALALVVGCGSSEPSSPGTPAGSGPAAGGQGGGGAAGFGGAVAGGGNGGTGPSGGSAGAAGASGGPGGAAGGGTGGSAGSAGNGGAVGNCVEIRIGSNLDVGVPTPWAAYLVSSEVLGITPDSIGVVFTALNAASDPVTAVATFDPNSGVNTATEKLPAADFMPGDFAVGTAWSPDGHFAIGSSVGAYLGTPASPDLKLTTAFDPAQWSVYSVTWDGEAFAVHANHGSSGPCPLGVARIQPDGTLLSPPSQYGTSCATTFGLGHQVMATDSSSGRTFVVDASFTLAVNGHDRMGAPLWLDAPKGLASVKDAYNPSVSADSTGAFIVTSPEPDAPGMGLHHPRLFRIDLDGSISSGGVLPLPDAESTTSDYAVSSSSATAAWFVANTQLRTYLVDMSGGVLSSPRVLIDTGISASDYQANPSKYDGHTVRVSDSMLAYDVGGRRWVAFQDVSSAMPAIRILRVDDPTCTYQPLNPLLPKLPLQRRRRIDVGNQANLGRGVGCARSRESIVRGPRAADLP